MVIPDRINLNAPISNTNRKPGKGAFVERGSYLQLFTYSSPIDSAARADFRKNPGFRVRKAGNRREIPYLPVVDATTRPLLAVT